MEPVHLQPLAMKPLRLGSIRPRGWLERQLRIQAESLSGRLDEFWPDVQDSQWFGGSAEGWERAPYWLDGLIPLAFVLGDDKALVQKAVDRMEYVLDHQHEDGWLGPKAMVAAGGQAAQPAYDLWGQILVTKVLWQYFDATGDPRARTALERVLDKIDHHIDTAPLFNWGQFRWYETLVALYELYEHTHRESLLDLAVELHAQGFDWSAFFHRWTITTPTPQGRWNYMGHVVNNAMAIKSPGLWWRMTGSEADRASAYDLIEKLDRYHGAVTGVMTGDECLAGTSPVQGTELCAVVEYMFSLETLLSIFGDPAFGDRLEKITFNALPATFSPDMWSHQYDQQVNQVECSIRAGRAWKTNRSDANIFGVDPDYGCCTANLSQGWPKFAAHLWMKTPGSVPGAPAGLAAAAYAPCRVETEMDGVPVTIDEETGYPFREDLHFSVAVKRPHRFALRLRIPAWAAGAQVRLPGGEIAHPEPGTFFAIDREWTGAETIDLHLPMRAELVHRPDEAAALQRGPLVYSLRIGEDWRRVRADRPYRELPHADWEIYATTPWNYALRMKDATLGQDLVFSETPIGDYPFSPQGAPVLATVKGRRVPGWDMQNGDAQPVPTAVETHEPLEDLTLIPYGCTNLRITEFPVIEE
jgi:uncharacterized protein